MTERKRAVPAGAKPGPAHGPLMVPALTVWNPWPWAILHAGKDIENRPWLPPASLHGSDLYIHAGKAWDDDGDEFLARLGITPPPRADLPAGSIVGVVRVTEWHWSSACVRLGPLGDLHPDGPYACSSFAVGSNIGHWELADPRPLDRPVECRGYQRLWYPSPAVVAAVNAQLPEPATVSGGAR